MLIEWSKYGDMWANKVDERTELVDLRTIYVDERTE